MGIASVLAVVLVVLKALGLVTLAWGWCLLGFGVDIVLVVACSVGAYFFAKSAVKKLDNPLPSRRCGIPRADGKPWPHR